MHNGEIVKMGPCGGLYGEEKSIDPFGVTGIKNIIICHGSAIYALIVHLRRDNSEEIIMFGQLPEFKRQTVPVIFYPSEYIISVTGYYGYLKDTVLVRSLKFVTNLRTHGPYGTEEGCPFILPAIGGRVVAFHVRCGPFINAIGTHVKVGCSSEQAKGSDTTGGTAKDGINFTDEKTKSNHLKYKIPSGSMTIKGNATDAHAKRWDATGGSAKSWSASGRDAIGTGDASDGATNVGDGHGDGTQCESKHDDLPKDKETKDDYPKCENPRGSPMTDGNAVVRSAKHGASTVVKTEGGDVFDGSTAATNSADATNKLRNDEGDPSYKTKCDNNSTDSKTKNDSPKCENATGRQAKGGDVISNSATGRSANNKDSTERFAKGRDCSGISSEVENAHGDEIKCENKNANCSNDKQTKDDSLKYENQSGTPMSDGNATAGLVTSGDPFGKKSLGCDASNGSAKHEDAKGKCAIGRSRNVGDATNESRNEEGAPSDKTNCEINSTDDKIKDESLKFKTPTSSTSEWNATGKLVKGGDVMGILAIGSTATSGDGTRRSSKGRDGLSGAMEVRDALGDKAKCENKCHHCSMDKETNDGSLKYKNPSSGPVSDRNATAESVTSGVVIDRKAQRSDPSGESEKYGDAQDTYVIGGSLDAGDAPNGSRNEDRAHFEKTKCDNNSTDNQSKDDSRKCETPSGSMTNGSDATGIVVTICGNATGGDVTNVYADVGDTLYMVTKIGYVPGDKTKCENKCYNCLKDKENDASLKCENPSSSLVRDGNAITKSATRRVTEGGKTQGRVDSDESVKGGDWTSGFTKGVVATSGSTDSDNNPSKPTVVNNTCNQSMSQNKTFFLNLEIISLGPCGMSEMEWTIPDDLHLCGKIILEIHLCSGSTKDLAIYVKVHI